MRKVYIGLFLTTLTSCALFNPGHSRKGKDKGAVQMPLKALPDSSKGSKLKPYGDVITKKAVTQQGLFVVHQLDDKYYFELPDSLFDREILVVTRFVRTPAGAGNYGGEALNEQTIRWVKGPAGKVFLRVVTLVNAADSTNAIYKAVNNANMEPIMAAFDIKANSKDSAGVVIDVTDFLKGDNSLLSFSAYQKKAYGFTALAADRSYISSVRSYPLNTEIRAVKTFNAIPVSETSRGLPATENAGAVTIELNNSFIMLPKVPMRKRFFDYRVGFFASDYVVYGDEQQQVKEDVYIHRWRLEPREEDMEKWKRGELVTPKKQIVYYIDPATPKKWRPYLIAGINDWQKAFEQAGFKDAIVGKEWPENDTTMSLEDARYSVVRYFASPRENAYGPNIADPRSGEILESHIGWYHNVMKLVHDWYMIQAGAVDQRARKMKFDDELMGQLIRFVSSHEIGHTLGLRHNMGASYATPVEKLRDKAWVEAHGHTSSIMDYARFNYVAQPEDNISPAGLYPRIGDYDKWAIQWGYKPILDVKTAEAEKPVLNKWIKDSLSANPRLWFSGEGRDFDPRSQAEDLGDNSVKASVYGMKNLQRIVPHLMEWTKEDDGDDYSNLVQMYKAVTQQFDRYTTHVLKNVGGIYQTAKSVDQPGELYAPVPKAIQKEAVAFLNQQLFQTPEWLMDKAILNRINNPYVTEQVSQAQSLLLMTLIGPGRLNRLVVNTNRFDHHDTYTAEELLEDVKAGIWKELSAGKAVSNMRRDLQKAYVMNIIALFDPSSIPAGTIQALMVSVSPIKNSNSDVPAIGRAHLIGLKRDIVNAIPHISDKPTKQHLEFLLYTINKALDKK
jgi:hypothetical protein